MPAVWGKVNMQRHFGALHSANDARHRIRLQKQEGVDGNAGEIAATGRNAVYRHRIWR